MSNRSDDEPSPAMEAAVNAFLDHHHTGRCVECLTWIYQAGVLDAVVAAERENEQLRIRVKHLSEAKARAEALMVRKLQETAAELAAARRVIEAARDYLYEHGDDFTTRHVAILRAALAAPVVAPKPSLQRQHGVHGLCDRPYELHTAHGVVGADGVVHNCPGQSVAEPVVVAPKPTDFAASLRHLAAEWRAQANVVGGVVNPRLLLSLAEDAERTAAAIAPVPEPEDQQ